MRQLQEMRPSDRAAALAITAAALGVYVATLAPGLIAITDTPKFQFIGRILGPAHAPGYPLYVLLSHVFGYLPIGSLAYRINLMAAVCGAATAGLTYTAARRLEAGRIASAAAALGLAFGSTVWYVSTIAEVYTLNAVFVAAVLNALFIWEKSRKAAWFFSAVALVGIALGNHTTAVLLVPATAAFACLAAPRFALHPRTIAVSAAIVALALTQYLFILVRTRQGVWGEAQAGNLPDLVRVVAGAQYFSDVLPGGVRQLLFERSIFVWRMFVRELSPAGVGFAALGIVVLVRRSAPTLALIAVGTLAYATFAGAYMPHQFEVFLIPGFMLCWLLVAVGGQALIDRLGRLGGAPGVGGVAAVAIVLAALPAWQVLRNYNARDLSHERADMRFFDALFDRLPDSSALLHEDFLVDRMVYYKTLGEQATRGRRMLVPLPAIREEVERAHRDRYRVFAFSESAKSLRLFEGIEFGYTPLDLSGGSLEQYVDDLPRGTLVAVAISGTHLPRLLEGDGLAALKGIGFHDAIVGQERGLAIVGTKGASATRGVSGNGARAVVEASQARPRITARADQRIAAIEFGDREILQTEAGIAVAVWRENRLTAAFVVDAESPAAPPPPTPYGVFELRALRQRLAVGPTPLDLTAVTATGNLVYKTETGRSHFVMYAGRARPLSPTLVSASARSWPALDVRRFDLPQASTAGDLVRALEQDGLPADPRLRAMTHVYRLALDTDWPAAAGVHLGLGGVPDVAIGRVVASEPSLVYGVDLSTHLTTVDQRTTMIHMARDYHEHLIGAGWSTVQADFVGPYRETVGREAELLLPLASSAPLRLGIQMIQLPGTGDARASIELEMNGRSLGSIEAEREWKRYWWNVPSDTLVSGVNSVVLAVAPEGQRIAVSDVLIRHLASSP